MVSPGCVNLYLSDEGLEQSVMFKGEYLGTHFDTDPFCDKSSRLFVSFSSWVK